MRIVIPIIIACLSSSALSQTFSDFPSYCRAMSEASTPTLLARTQNVSRAQAEALIQGITDPKAMRTIRDVLDFAYARPVTASVEVLRAELENQCIAKNIFAE